MILPEDKTSNSDLVNQYIDWGSPINQMFLFDAMGKLSKSVIKHQDELRVSMKNSFVCPEAWIEAAKEWASLIEQREQINKTKYGS
jgi:hypothetical protein